MSEQIFVFDKTAKVAEVEIEVLSQSVEIKAAGSNDPGPTRPIQSWELISSIQEMAEKAGVKTTLDPIWVERKASNRALTKEETAIYDEKNTPANKWMFNNVVTRFNMEGTDEMNPSVGISFNQKGIQVVWGTNVMVCQNMCVFGENMISTYGADRTPFGKQMQLLEFWMSKMEEKFEDDKRIITRMQEIEVGPSRVDEIIGDLYSRAIEKVYVPKTKVVSPMNTYALSAMVQGMVKEDTPIDSVWDLYNAGTAIMKPGQFGLEDVYPVNKAWGSFIQSEFNIN